MAAWKMRSNPNVRKFRALVRDFYRRHGRKQLPWRCTRNPYRIVVSEIMLQQTQVAHVLTFYPRFIERFPDFRALANAPTRAVLKAWQGLGYNRRALAVQRLAETVMQKYGGKLPRNPATLEELPGVGHATAACIAAFAFGIGVPFLETNIRRAIIHHFFPRKKKVSEKEILALVGRTLPQNHSREWYYALMDYGSWLATQVENPNRRRAMYRPSPKFSGSSRELRGKILKLVLRRGKISPREAARALSLPLTKTKSALAALQKEGFI